MENEFAKQTQIKPLSWHKSISIEEFCDDDGILNNQNIDESTWLKSLSYETQLDCRMIIDFKPVKQLGRERWEVIVNINGKAIVYIFHVWIVVAPG
jgi:hypothetical protein